MAELKWLFVIATLIAWAPARAEFDLTVVQTADIHSHFTNRDSQLGLGGLARVMTKVNEIRAAHKNTLVLDAGDWSEGTMFFTLDTGETSQRLLELMNYDAVVLGNHDWLVGPQALFNAFENVGMRTPVLSANLDLSKLPPSVDLSKYIKPYIVKDYGGVRVGILGLSTFQLIYDSYFKPVKLREPVGVARHYVDILRNKEHCQIVILLSHLGIGTDKTVGRLVKGIDYIVGGHTHILLTTPAHGGSTPITHVGCWGQYVGQTDLVYKGGKTNLVRYQVYKMDDSVPEDPEMAAMVSGALIRMQEKYGNVLADNVVTTDVDLPAQRTSGENQLGNWAVDAIRDAGQSDLAVDTPFYASRDFFRGTIQTADFFDAFPHIYNPYTQKAWTIKTFKLDGWALKFLMDVVGTMGFSLEVSNANVIMDEPPGGLKRVKSVEVGGRKLGDFTKYKIAATDGIWDAIQFLEGYGVHLGASGFEDTGQEAWRVILQAVQARSPITAGKIHWEGRIRTVQPDLEVRPEETQIHVLSPDAAVLSVTVRNTGLTPSAPARLAATTADNEDAPAATTGAPVPALAPGEDVHFDLPLKISGRPPGRTPVSVSVSAVAGEGVTANNETTTVLNVPDFAPQIP